MLKRLIPTSILVGMDSLAQLTGDYFQLTPSVFLRAKADGNTPINTSDSIFRCPSCGGQPLEEIADALRCPSCSSRWAINEGIYDFRQPLD